MFYKTQLEGLRKELFADLNKVDFRPAPNPKSEGWIKPLMKPEPLKDVEENDSLKMFKDFLRKTKAVAAKAKEEREKSAQVPVKSVATGFIKAITPRPNPRNEEGYIPEEFYETGGSPDARQERNDAARAYGKSGDISSFLGIMDKHEGGGSYDTLFGHSQDKFGVKPSEMTLGELYAFSDPSGEYGQWVKGQVGRVATPMGRYQFVGSTLKATAKKMGLSDDTVFDKQTQDALFAYKLNERLSGASTMADKVKAIRSEWEGFRSVPTSVLEGLIENWESPREKI